MFKLPDQLLKADTKDPRKLVIASHTKVGKTSLVRDLPNHLLIDLEDGSHFVEASKVNAKALSNEYNMHILDVLDNIASQIREKNEAKNGYAYDYIILDTTSAIEKVALELAAVLYKSTPLGKNWKGGMITNLPNGAGYGWLREAFEKIYDKFDGLYGKCLILFAHVKKSSITKEGKDVGARDIDLTGKLKQIVCAEADAIGFMYRAKSGTENILSFKTSPQDLATGARPEHLSNQEFVISEKMEDGTIKTHWDKVFTSLK